MATKSSQNSKQSSADVPAVDTKPKIDSLVGTKVKLKVGRRKFTARGQEFSLPEYELTDPAFEKTLKSFTTDYKLFLPQTRLSQDSTHKYSIFIDPTGIVTQIKKE